MRSVLVFSGGLDSTVLLHHLLGSGDEVHALSVLYGQRHAREVEAARRLAVPLGVEHRVVDLYGVLPLLRGSALTDPAVPVQEGHYAEASMKATVVPNRNMMLLAVAAAWAVALKADRVAYAAHGGDHAIYPDCRPEFVVAMDVALGLCDWHPLTLYAPFLDLTKTDVVRKGVELGVDFAETYSCYVGGPLHCGRCGTCVERREAFKLAGVVDPTAYAEASCSS